MVTQIAVRAGLARSRKVAALAVAGATALLGLALPPSAAAQQPVQAERTEEPVTGSATGDGVQVSYVSLYAPMPDAAPAHPAACDRLGYLRVRAADGPADPAETDNVYVLMPGILAGAGSLEPVARNVVRAAAETGKQVEVWALDRRSNCLEDHTGLLAAADASSADVAFDYYFDGAEQDGRSYAGTASAADTAFLNEVGLAQTVQDYATVLMQLPASYRSKVMCGGHSLGGPITAALSSWDFNGTPGYTLCGGYYVLDSRLSITRPGTEGLAALQAMLPVGLADALSGLRAASPYINLSPLTPQTFALLGVLNTAAGQAPDARSTVLPRIPRDLNFEVALRLFGAKDWASALTGQPDLRDFNATNATVLGTVLDDNSSPITILRASFGAPTGGGSIAPKNFPLPYGTPSNSLLGGNKLVIASDPAAVSSWLNYDELPAAGATTADGDVFTTPASEITDVQQFASAFSIPESDGTEWYFPIRLVTDLQAAQLGDRHGLLAGLRYDGPNQRPAIYFDAGDSGVADGPAIGGPIVNGGVQVVLPGYNHLDVTTAAWKQNDGRPEQISHRLVEFTAGLPPR
ncbi:hypothetical protein [Rhodococcus sp. X156]|uniref:hypothetical protein n=1 Tax=Rhodococcus sp. X156 TaxID=2499145 RepID=UPI0013E37C4E|nr:hypothetical protein [Rhodococcus sp. X156]